MAYKTIPQIEFDRAVQKFRAIKVGQRTAESLVLALWKISQDLKRNFRQMIDAAVKNGRLNVDQSILNRINTSLPNTVNYGIKTTVSSFYVVANETIYNEYQYSTEDEIPLESEIEQDLMVE